MFTVSHKRLGKDQRNKFINEFEQDGKLSDPNFYAIMDKNGKVQIRREKAEKVDSEQKEQEPEQAQPAPEEPASTTKERKEKTL